MELADRQEPFYSATAPIFHNIIPLPEVLGEILGVGPASKAVEKTYGLVISHFSSEFGILLQASAEEIREFSPLLAEAIRRMRQGQVIRQGGYDGEFGTIRLFENLELRMLRESLGPIPGEKPRRSPK